ncbi:AAA family ATPase [Methylorubrum rhodesianum]|uniref:AAA family ATPase n=1 Tax=Methylorubrum rhodesianum TaxID=29427 RepID=A0ABU9ZGF5_9HYPH
MPKSTTKSTTKSATTSATTSGPAAKPTPPRRLAHIARRISAQDADDFQAETTFGQAQDLAADVRVGPVLAMALVQDAFKPADLKRLAVDAGLAVVVAVPAPDWVDPIAKALSQACEWGDLVKRNGLNRLQDKPETGCESVAEALGAGQNAIGVSNAPERYLPANLTALADIRVEIKVPGPRALRSAIRLATGSRPGPIPPGAGAGLPFSTLAGCIRRGSTGPACVRRIAAASRALTSAGAGLAEVPFFEDCVGYEGEPRRWGLDLIAAVREYRAGKRAWGTIEDRNIVLGGEAGVGKSSFARSLAKSLGMPLFATSVSAWFASTGGYLHEIVRQFDAVVAQAVAAGPAVIMLDEIDSIPNRATIDNRNRDYWVPVVSHILTTLDSAVSGQTSSLIVIGATNFPERLDEALVRPGRLNRVVRIGRPDVAAIGGILRQHLGDDLRGLDLGPVAALGAGATGAEVAGWAKRARGAARAAGRPMTRADLVAQVVPPETRGAEEVLAVARHEAAHCAVGELTGAIRVESVTVAASGPYAGLTRSRVRGRTNFRRRDLDDYVVTLLAGRAADALWGGVHSGAAGQPGSDLAAATRLVAAAHASYGLGDDLVWLGSEDDAMQMVRLDAGLRRRVGADLDALQARADALVRENAETIDALAGRLVRMRVLSGDEVRRIVSVGNPGLVELSAAEVRDA